jgi:3-hydroxybutyryl-CoA dehydrogenase
MAEDGRLSKQTTSDAPSIRRVAVVGCGLMGRGIVEACARAGLEAIAIKATPGDVGTVRADLARGLEGHVKKGKLDAETRDAILARLSFSTRLEDVAEADLVIESALEAVSAKQQLLEVIEQLAKPGAIVATNTSSLPLREVGARLTREDRFLGLHFFSPAVVMKLCEVSPTPSTDPKVVEAVVRFVEGLGKTPVLVRDEPGYIVNRLLVPYLLLAMHTLEDGIAGPESIDAAMKLGCGHPMGPLALSDLIGLDVVLAMAKSMGEEYRDTRYHAPPVLRRLVLANHLGKKTGAGFYLYTDVDVRPNPSVLSYVNVPRGRAAAG